MAMEPQPTPVAADFGEAEIHEEDGTRKRALVTAFSTYSGQSVFFWDVDAAEEFFKKGLARCREMRLTHKKLITPPEKSLHLPPSYEVREHIKRATEGKDEQPTDATEGPEEEETALTTDLGTPRQQETISGPSEGQQSSSEDAKEEPEG